MSLLLGKSGAFGTFLGPSVSQCPFGFNCQPFDQLLGQFGTFWAPFWTLLELWEAILEHLGLHLDPFGACLAALGSNMGPQGPHGTKKASQKAPKWEPK